MVESHARNITRQLRRPDCDWAVVDAEVRDLLHQTGIPWQELSPYISHQSFRAWYPQVTHTDPPPDGASIVYFVSVEGGRYIKIGTTSRFSARLREYQTHSPFDITVEGWEPGARKLERALHERFAHLRVRGEWFLRQGDLTDYIANLP